MSGMQIHIDTVHIDQIVTSAPAPSLAWHVGPMQRKEGMMPIEVTMTSEEKCRLSITPLTPGGQPAPIDGDAQWTVAGTCTLEPIDATSVWAIAGGVGDSVITAACDADLGQGVVPLADTCTIHVSNPMAASLGMAADPPVLQSA